MDELNLNKGNFYFLFFFSSSSSFDLLFCVVFFVNLHFDSHEYNVSSHFSLAYLLLNNVHITQLHFVSFSSSSHRFDTELYFKISYFFPSSWISFFFFKLNCNLLK